MNLKLPKAPLAVTSQLRKILGVDHHMGLCTAGAQTQGLKNAMRGLFLDPIPPLILVATLRCKAHYRKSANTIKSQACSAA